MGAHRMVSGAFGDAFQGAPCGTTPRGEGAKPALDGSDDERVPRNACPERVRETSCELKSHVRAERLAGAKPEQRLTVRNESITDSEHRGVQSMARQRADSMARCPSPRTRLAPR